MASDDLKALLLEDYRYRSAGMASSEQAGELEGFHGHGTSGGPGGRRGRRGIGGRRRTAGNGEQQG